MLTSLSSQSRPPFPFFPFSTLRQPGLQGHQTNPASKTGQTTTTMDSITKVEYNVRNLSTRSVTLFPTRAQVFRDIKDVPLHPGTNEISILGLSPTVDEDSIKVEGSGSAIISNIAVESLPNRDIFEEVYPDSDDDKLSGDESSDDSHEIELPDSPELTAAKARSAELGKQLKAAQEQISSANSRLQALDGFSKTLDAKHGVPIGESMYAYANARASIFDDRIEGERRERELQPLLRTARDELERLHKLHRRETERANRERRRALVARTKAKIKEARREEERLAEKERVRKERRKFWPRYCYAVRITLEAAGVYTPQSSRRNSVSSDIDVAAAAAAVEENSATPTQAAVHEDGIGLKCNLVLSYVTSAASWAPSYDLQLSTTSGTGTLCFDAQLTNTTSETWEKCRVTLSTSQATSSSLSDTAPVLAPWPIKLDSHAPENSLLYSVQERSYKASLKNKQSAAGAGKPRSEMFGVDATENKTHSLQDYQIQLMLLEQQNKKRLMMAREEQEQQGPWTTTKKNVKTKAKTNPFAYDMFGDNGSRPGQCQQMQQQAFQHQQQQQQMQPQMQSINMANAAPFDLFGSNPAPAPAPAPAAAIQRPRQSSPPLAMSIADLDDDAGTDTDTDIQQQHQQQLDFQESLVEETGFTTSYDLPGTKTLSPSSSSSKQRIARVHFPSVVFSHAVVAKCKPAAHLSAKLHNTSRLTLLRGPAGVTLDGSFAGRTTLPRCGGGESVSLSLGVDPAVRVAYAPPEVRRVAAAGFFAKEDVRVYTRVVRLENTRASNTRHTKLLVRDQVPVSRDEKLRVELLRPEGLVAGGESRAAGEAGRDRDRDDWGTAQASLHKDGEVNWLVALRPGRSVKLVLEYQVSMPVGDQAVQATA